MTRLIGVVACSKSKLPYAAPAREIYQGALFKLAKARVITTCEEWCILSAEYGVLLPDQIIEPYDTSLQHMRAPDRRAWAERANADLVRIFGRDVLYIVFAGIRHRAALDGLEHSVPLVGLGIGKQMQRLRLMLSAEPERGRDAPCLKTSR